MDGLIIGIDLQVMGIVQSYSWLRFTKGVEQITLGTAKS